jgi:hypothetical protein
MTERNATVLMHCAWNHLNGEILSKIPNKQARLQIKNHVHLGWRGR